MVSTVYKKTQAYEITRKFRESKNTNEDFSGRESHGKRADRKRTADFVHKLKEKIDVDPGCSMGMLAKEMGVMRSAISLEDLGYKSFVLRNRQLLKERNKANRKLQCQALLNDIKRWMSTAYLKFSLDEKSFI